MRQRFLVGVKLVETLSRGLFVLACTYRLPLVEAGRFGLTATIIGLLAFLLGYERQIDVQRQVAGRSAGVILDRFRDTLRFFACQYVLVLPATAVVLLQATQWPALDVACVLLIVVGEHLSNQAYQAMLVDKQAFPMMVAVTIKSALLLLAVLLGSWQLPDHFNAVWVLRAWTAASLAYIALATVMWWGWSRRRALSDEPAASPQAIGAQYRASWLHFVIGVVAVATLQMDRLVIGGLLSAADIGVFFRNVTFSALSLQIFNIVFFARLSPAVYRAFEANRPVDAIVLVRRQLSIFICGLTCTSLLAFTVNFLLGDPLVYIRVQAIFMLPLLAAVCLRCIADCQGLLILAKRHDGAVLSNQVKSLVVGLPTLALSTYVLGLPGAFFGSMMAPATYAALNYISNSQTE